MEAYFNQTNKAMAIKHICFSYMNYRRVNAKFDSRILLQMGGYGKKFGLKSRRDEVGIEVEHGTLLFMKYRMIGKDGGYCACGVPKSLKNAGSSVIIIDFVKKAEESSNLCV